MKNVIFIAPPAAGKGTQSIKLKEMGYIHIATGDMLREEVKSQSELGKEIDAIMQKGGLVNDEIVFELIKKKLINLHSPFILDGFPRSLKQANLLDELFKELEINNYEVIYLDITLEEALKRALGRLTCSCGASYNIYFKELMPKVDGICDKCGNVLVQRKDDNENSFKIRFENFLDSTLPVREYYQHKNKLHVIDATLDTNIITDKIKEILK